ncbi:hypothetical protein MKA31_05060 [[Clostridium] innocuum]|uniref:hypothetical protein n=1 Tax=Clostridium innocuum TaxID=1522 RepID=UPI0021493D22|nr:hypothetical protein [[Clostridium] innocuum]MCR0271452.1 hypothetical protein [[Clostridium] innocuum]
MKKSTLLSLLTAGAVIATSAGTFAAWDQTKAEKTATLALDKPVEVSFAASDLELNTTRSIGTDPIYTGTTIVNVKDVPSGADASYEIKYDAKVYKSNDASKTALTGFTVTAEETPTAASLTDPHTVSVTVTPGDDAAVKKLATDGTELTVEVTAELASK